MARRPLAFGVRLRDRDRERTVKIRPSQSSPRQYVIEDERPGEPSRSHRCADLAEAVHKGASIWRHRLN
jgi:hypothetical protein